MVNVGDVSYEIFFGLCLGGAHSLALSCEQENVVAIMFMRAQMIGRGAGRNIISAAAYRHRTRMRDEQTGTLFNYRGGDDDLVHEELALPEDIPAWLQTAI